MRIECSRGKDGADCGDPDIGQQQQQQQQLHTYCTGTLQALHVVHLRIHIGSETMAPTDSTCMCNLPLNLRSPPSDDLTHNFL